MSEWKETCLTDICSEISYGYTASANKNNLGPKFLRITDIVPKRINWSEVPNCLASEKDVEKYKLNEGDIVIARTGATTGYNKIIKNLEYVAVYASYLVRFVIDKKLAYPEYIGHVLQSSLWYDYIVAISGGSAQPGANAKQLGSFEFQLPPLNEQKAIAAVLSSLDDKIDLLHRQNKTLETMAETLFRQWFIEEASEEWEVEPLGKYVTVKRGGSPRPIQDYISETGLRWLKISDASQTASPYIFEIKEHIKEEGITKTTLLKSGSLVLSNSATPGIPKILQVDSCIHDGWLHFPKSHFSNEFLYLLFKKIRLELLSQGNGSIFTNLKTDILKEYAIPIPDLAALQNFDGQIKPLFKKILGNSVQILTLENLRNSLLPKLMSGTIRVNLS